jgi:hypothetical protein
MRMMVGPLVALATLVISSQARAEVQLGVLGGTNIASLEFSEEDPDVELSAEGLVAAGLVVEAGLGSRLSLQFEPMYVQKGGRIEIRDLFGEDVAGSLRFSYVELPVLLKVSKSTGSVRPYLLLGPSMGYRRSAKLMDETAGVTDEGPEFEESFETWDFGVSGGGGLSVPLDRATVFLEGRYTWGLANLNAPEEGVDLDVKHRGMQILAGFTFPVGRR